MKTKALVLSCFMGAAVLCMGYEVSQTPLVPFEDSGYSVAEPEADKPGLKIGVISVWKIFEDSTRITKYRQEALGDQQRVGAELDRLAKEIEVGRAGLKTLKPGSSDHLTLVREILQKQSKHETQQEYYKLQMALREQRMIEGLYEDILRETNEVAKQKGLDLVFEKSQPRFPARGTKELELVMQTHKLLYSGGSLDITYEVMARVDAKGSKK